MYMIQIVQYKPSKAPSAIYWKSIAACTINCWSNVTGKLIQCGEHTHTQICQIYDILGGQYHECHHHCKIYIGKNLKLRKTDLAE